jgi:hypothetical protein
MTAAPPGWSLPPYGSLLRMAADAAPGVAPGTAVRSIAAEDYRLARDRGASFGRGKEEARAERILWRYGERLTEEYGVVMPGDRLTSPKASRF